MIGQAQCKLNRSSQQGAVSYPGKLRFSRPTKQTVARQARRKAPYQGASRVQRASTAQLSASSRFGQFNSQSLVIGPSAARSGKRTSSLWNFANLGFTLSEA